MKRIALPALIVVLVVATYVGVAGWNRSAPPQLVITVTERELELSAGAAAAPGDDPGLRLSLRYEGRHDPLDARNWLPEARLREIGFPFQVPVTAPRAFETYARVPPRTAWVVFEYDGPQWMEIARRRALQDEQGRRQPEMTSRLVPVDAGPDFEALRRRYPTGHLMLPGVIGLAYVGAADGGPMVYGTLRQIVPHTLAVPRRLRSVLDDLAGREQEVTAPRYEVDVAVGRLGLPYVRAVRRMGQAGASD